MKSKSGNGMRLAGSALRRAFGAAALDLLPLKEIVDIH